MQRSFIEPHLKQGLIIFLTLGIVYSVRFFVVVHGKFIVVLFALDMPQKRGCHGNVLAVATEYFGVLLLREFAVLHSSAHFAHFEVAIGNRVVDDSQFRIFPIDIMQRQHVAVDGLLVLTIVVGGAGRG